MVRQISQVIVLAANAFAQDANPIHVRAGDLAPSITWTKNLGSSTSGKYAPGSLRGHVTVITFLPYVSGNESFVLQWNELVAKFAGKPVNFVWMASEDPHTLEPWLPSHPVNGWLLLDPNWETGRAYGIVGGDSAIIGPDGRLAGFGILLPQEAEIAEVLSGKAKHLKPEPSRMPTPEAKPNLPASYDLHVSPTKSEGNAANGGPDYWIKRGFDLKSIIAMVYETDKSRVALPASLDDGKRYDFVLVLPREEDQNAINRFVQQGIEKQFHVSISHENRMTDVYVMTALPGKTPPAKKDSGGTLISASSVWMDAVPKEGSKPGIDNITAYDSPMDDFRRILEEFLKRPILDETNMKDSYDLVVNGGGKTPEEFIAAMRTQAGLVLNAAQRPIEMIVVNPIKQAN